MHKKKIKKKLAPSQQPNKLQITTKHQKKIMFHFPNFLTNQIDYTSTKISKILSTTHFGISDPSIKKIPFGEEEDDDDELLWQWCEQNHDKSTTNLERENLSALAYVMPIRACVFVWERKLERRRWWLVAAMDSDCTQRERERERES